MLSNVYFRLKDKDKKIKTKTKQKTKNQKTMLNSQKQSVLLYSPGGVLQPNAHGKSGREKTWDIGGIEDKERHSHATDRPVCRPS